MDRKRVIASNIRSPGSFFQDQIEEHFPSKRVR